MMKIILSSLAGLILLLPVAAPLHAASVVNPEMRVSVPFEFAAGDRILPASDYTVHANPERGIVVLVGEGQKPLTLLTIRQESSSAPWRGKLVFRRYGGLFFLGEVWNEDNATGQRLAPRAQEKELARKQKAEQILVVQVR